MFVQVGSPVSDAVWRHILAKNSSGKIMLRDDLWEQFDKKYVIHQLPDKKE